jgi:carbon-monoxide dehydrogenase large subunit
VTFVGAPTRLAAQGFGKPVLRKEDARLLTGQGRFSDDINLPNQAYAVMVRSPHAHARIRAIDAHDALASPSVLTVLTGADAVRDRLQPLPHKPIPTNPHEVPLRNRDGRDIFVAPHWPLAHNRARFVGEAVAMVIATSVAAAKDAAERVAVDYEPLPAIAATRDAPAPTAPRVHEAHDSNVCVASHCGDEVATAAAFARAAHVVQLDTWVQRVTGVPLEPRAAVAVFDDVAQRYTLYAGSGGNIRHRADLAGVLGVAESAVRVIAYDTGGNFGTRNSFYPEFALVAWAAKRIGRPVKWTCERQEALLTDYQGRDLVSQLELALDEQGQFLALRGLNTSNVGAASVSFIPLAKGVELSTTVYAIPHASMRGRAVLSNTAPTTPYRSAGRPEVMFAMERLIDIAARRGGFDRLELRRRNLIAAESMPYRNALGMLYDSGDYRGAQARAVELADWAGFAARRREARARGRLRGIGIANYIEVASGFPRERAEITVHAAGSVDIVLGTLSAAQGHDTAFAQLVAEWLGVGIDEVRLLTGDNDVAAIGGGAHSGRSMRLGGWVMAKASDQIVEKGTRLAARLLEAAEADIEFTARRFRVKGTDRSVDLYELAAAAMRTDLPEALRGPLAGVSEETLSTPTFPYGSHVCEVEVDPETGAVEVVRYVAVDDVGRAVNPMLVHGQTHGGIAQGVGQALWEHCHYDAASGQMLAATFMDYAMPRADMLPAFCAEISEVPSTSNPLGLRGGGEGGTTGALGAVVNAIVDALAELGVEHIDMPVTVERVWRAMREQGL